MGIKGIVRRVKDKDISKIVKLNHKIVDKWRHVKINSQNLENMISFGEETIVQHLSPFERWYHGGYWNDELICRWYIQQLRLVPGEVFVFESQAGKIIGEIDFCWTLSVLNAENYGRLLWIVVDPEIRNQNIGQRLFNAAKEKLLAKGIRKFRTWPENENSEKFYRKIGFEQDYLIWKVTSPSIPSNRTIPINWNISIISDIRVSSFLSSNWYEIMGNNCTPNYDIRMIKVREQLEDLLGQNLDKIQMQSPFYLIEYKHVELAITKCFSLKIWVKDFPKVDQKTLNYLFTNLGYIAPKFHENKKIRGLVIGDDRDYFINAQYEVEKQTINLVNTIESEE